MFSKSGYQLYDDITFEYTGTEEYRGNEYLKQAINYTVKMVNIGPLNMQAQQYIRTKSILNTQFQMQRIYLPQQGI